jgi:hypothetical protein
MGVVADTFSTPAHPTPAPRGVGGAVRVRRLAFVSHGLVPTTESPVVIDAVTEYEMCLPATMSRTTKRVCR